MPEVIPSQQILKCRGCPRQFDSTDDVCQVQLGQTCGLCRRCHVTALGPNAHAFNDVDLL